MARKALWFICWLLLFWLVPVSCLAAQPETVTMTISEYNELWTALQELKTFTALSNLDSNESSKLLLQAKLELKKSLAESERLLVLWKTVQNESVVAQEIIKQLRSELSSLKTSFERYIRENKPKRNSIGIYAFTSSGGIFYEHDRFRIYGGQKWAGGFEVGTSYKIIVW